MEPQSRSLDFRRVCFTPSNLKNAQFTSYRNQNPTGRPATNRTVSATQTPNKRKSISAKVDSNKLTAKQQLSNRHLQLTIHPFKEAHWRPKQLLPNLPQLPLDLCKTFQYPALGVVLTKQWKKDLTPPLYLQLRHHLLIPLLILR